MKIHTVQLHLGDLLGGTQHMDNGELGAYVALFLACYAAKDYILPNDDSRLARIAKCRPSEWRRVRDVVMEKFVIIDDKVMHKRVMEDVEKYAKKSETNRANRLKGLETPQPVVNQSSTDGVTTRNPRPKNQDSDPSVTDGVGVLTTSGGDSGVRGYDVERHLDDNARQRAKANAPGWDLYPLIGTYNAMIRSGERDAPDNPSAAFPAWVKLYTKGKKL